MKFGLDRSRDQNQTQFTYLGEKDGYSPGLDLMRYFALVASQMKAQADAIYGGKNYAQRLGGGTYNGSYSPVDYTQRTFKNLADGTTWAYDYTSQKWWQYGADGKPTYKTTAWNGTGAGPWLGQEMPAGTPNTSGTPKKTEYYTPDRSRKYTWDDALKAWKIWVLDPASNQYKSDGSTVRWAEGTSDGPWTADKAYPGNQDGGPPPTGERQIVSPDGRFAYKWSAKDSAWIVMIPRAGGGWEITDRRVQWTEGESEGPWTKDPQYTQGQSTDPTTKTYVSPDGKRQYTWDAALGGWKIWTKDANGNWNADAGKWVKWDPKSGTAGPWTSDTDYGQAGDTGPSTKTYVSPDGTRQYTWDSGLGGWKIWTKDANGNWNADAGKTVKWDWKSGTAGPWTSDPEYTERPPGPGGGPIGDLGSTPLDGAPAGSSGAGPGGGSGSPELTIPSPDHSRYYQWSGGNNWAIYTQDASGKWVPSGKTVQWQYGSSPGPYMQDQEYQSIASQFKYIGADGKMTNVDPYGTSGSNNGSNTGNTGNNNTTLPAGQQFMYYSPDKTRVYVWDQQTGKFRVGVQTQQGYDFSAGKTVTWKVGDSEGPWKADADYKPTGTTEAGGDAASRMAPLAAYSTVAGQGAPVAEGMTYTLPESVTGTTPTQAPAPAPVQTATGGQEQTLGGLPLANAMSNDDDTRGGPAPPDTWGGVTPQPTGNGDQSDGSNTVNTPNGDDYDYLAQLFGGSGVGDDYQSPTDGVGLAQYYSYQMNSQGYDPATMAALRQTAASSANNAWHSAQQAAQRQAAATGSKAGYYGAISQAASDAGEARAKAARETTLANYAEARKNQQEGSEGMKNLWSQNQQQLQEMLRMLGNLTGRQTEVYNHGASTGGNFSIGYNPAGSI